MQVSIIQATQTRPANTTAYSAGEVFGVTMQFNPLGGGLGLGGEIKAANCNTSQAPATPPDLELWLFTAPLTTPPADAATFNPVANDMLNFIGIIPFATGSFKKSSARQACSIIGTDIPAPGSIYGVLVVRNAYVPVSGEVINVVLNVLRDYGAAQ